ncbi:DNA polymerase III subunit beta [Synechococcus elongatus]|uniref:Beta sliding clamp n=1 Tax=Synechococcus elongatus PCC 11802 TaxID=2283154 RepID=A0AAT9JVL6_SYNEL|nr:DNA polymerase III subunit beta [Synechococcus elongatus]
MKLVCRQNELNTSLSLVSRAVPSRPNHPVLANVLLAADAGTQRLSLTAFDLSLGIQTSFAAQIERSGAITLPAKLLNDIVSRLPNDSDVTLEEQETAATLSVGSGQYQMRGISADEFPELPLVQSQEALQLSASALIEGLRGTLFATSSDETKQVLTGVHLKVQPDGLEFAATDGHRLAVVKTENAAAIPAAEFAVTVPSRALRDLERMISIRGSDEAIALYHDQGQIVFQWGDQYLTSRTLDGQYPNYGQLIPREFNRNVAVDRKRLLAALDRIAVLADQQNNAIRLTLDPDNNRLALAVDAQDVGSGQEAVPAEIIGEPLEIAFNVRYLSEGLKALNTTDIQIQLNSNTSPVVLSPLGPIKITYLVMPIQLRS